MRMLSVLALPAILLVACETADGTSFGWVQSYGALRETCGREVSVGLENQTGYVTTIRGIGTTWFESTNTAVCRSSSETGDRYLAEPGWLGNSVRVMENGVTCAYNSMSYNAPDAYSLTSVADCANDYPTDRYQTEVVHRWWSADTSTYAQVTARSATLSL